MNGYAHHVDSLDENCWTDLIDYSGLLDDGVPPSGLYWNPQLPAQKWVSFRISFFYNDALDWNALILELTLRM